MYMIVYVIYRYNTDICVIMCVYLCNMCIQTQYKIDPRLGQCKTTLICSTFLSSKSRLPCLNKKQRSRSLHFIQVISSRPFMFSFGSPCNMLTASHHKALAFETHLSPDTQHSYSKGFAAWTDSFHFHSLTSIHHLISVATVGDDGWPFSDFFKIRALRLATSCNVFTITQPPGCQ